MEQTFVARIQFFVRLLSTWFSIRLAIDTFKSLNLVINNRDLSRSLSYRTDLLHSRGEIDMPII